MVDVRKHPAPQGALRRPGSGGDGELVVVRKHPAPQGALRRPGSGGDGELVVVRKHPAPQGALRRVVVVADDVERAGQKAPKHHKVH